MGQSISEDTVDSAADIFFGSVSDDDLEGMAGDAQGLYCSCGGCTSACSQGSRA